MLKQKGILGSLACFALMVILCSAVAVLLGTILDISGESSLPAAAGGNASPHKMRFVIDAGHGGEDGGASVGSVLEKDLNLEIALTLYELYSLLGADVVMTRTTDIMLYDIYDELDDYSGMKKIYDLKNRVRIAKEAEADMFISIHMNSFPSPNVRGLQVYYSPLFAESADVAQRVQGYVKEYLQSFNQRSIKAGRGIYVLERSQIPAILIECGFLSSADELTELTSDDYVRKLAVCISAATFYKD